MAKDKSGLYYIHVSVEPPTRHVPTLIHCIQTALLQCCGITRARTYIDCVWVSDTGDEYVLRTGKEDAKYIEASVVVTSKPRAIRSIRSSRVLEEVLQQSPISPEELASIGGVVLFDDEDQEPLTRPQNSVAVAP